MDKPKAIWFNKKIVAVVAILVIVGLAAYWVRHKMAEDKDPAALEVEPISISVAASTTPEPSQNTFAGRPVSPALSRRDRALLEPLQSYTESICGFMGYVQVAFPKETHEWRGMVKRLEFKDERTKRLAAKVFQERSRLVSACRQEQSIPPAFVYADMFVNPGQVIKLADGLKSFTLSYGDEKAFQYMCLIDPLWCVKHMAEIAAAPDNRIFDTPELLPTLPKYLRDLSILDFGDAKSPRYGSIAGLHHFFVGDLLNERANDFYGRTITALRLAGGSLKGKNVADVGCGTGFMLSLFRRDMGREGKLYAIDIDVVTNDFVRFAYAEEYQVTVIDGLNNDIEVPEDSCDVINMSSVHMGPGLDNSSEAATLAWLATMHRALRPGGFLVIDDDQISLLSQGLEKKVESVGFKCTVRTYDGAAIRAKDFKYFTFVFKKM